MLFSGVVADKLQPVIFPCFCKARVPDLDPAMAIDLESK